MIVITYSSDVEALRKKAVECIQKGLYPQYLCFMGGGKDIQTGEDLPVTGLKLWMDKTNTIYAENGKDSISLIKLPSHEVYDEDGNLAGFMKLFEGYMEPWGVGVDANEAYSNGFSKAENLGKYDKVVAREYLKDTEGNDTGELAPRSRFGGFDR